MKRGIRYLILTKFRDFRDLEKIAKFNTREI